MMEWDRYKIIQTEKELDRLIKYCKKTGYASVDFETSGHEWHSPLGYPTILGVSFQPGSAWVIPLGHFDSPFKDNWEYILSKFCREVIENPKVIKIAQNIKFEMKWFRKYGHDMKGILFDNMLAKYLLDEERPMGLKPMVDKFFPKYAGYAEDYEGHRLPWDQKPLIGLSQYCALDCSLTFQLMMFYEHQLIKNKLYALFRNMMMMGARVLNDSEIGGMLIDSDILSELEEKYELLIIEKDKQLRLNKKIRKIEKGLVQGRVDKYIESLEEEISDIQNEIEELEDEKKIAAKERLIKGREEKIDRMIAGEFKLKSELKFLEPLNFGSPQQLVELLFTSKKGFRFEVINFTVNKDTKEETDTPSTDEATLMELMKVDKSGFIKGLLEIRGLNKMYSTYIKGMRALLSVDSRVHPRFLLEGTTSGRLSSAKPNAQQIPRVTSNPDIKRMFIPPKGHVILSVDYSQAELRVMAAMAEETNMIKWFNEGKDIHLSVALQKNHQEDRYDEVKAILKSEDGSEEFIFWTKERKYAKTINFGIIYGQGADKLSESLECSVNEARKFLNDYFKLYPKIKKFINKQHRLVHEQGYVRSLFGRKRRLPDIDSPQKYLVAQAERQSVNAPIQGAASDYALFSSILIYEGMKKGEIPIGLPQVATVHDSLMYYVRPEVIHQVVKQINDICTNPQTQEWFGFQIDTVKMEVDFELSHINWAELRNYNPDTDYTAIVKEYKRG